MSWLETLRTGLNGVWSHRLRSGLTVLGILIGIAAVILTVGLGEGAQAQVSSEITALGTNLLSITPGSTTSSAGDSRGARHRVDVNDVGRFRARLPRRRPRHQGRRPRHVVLGGAGGRLEHVDDNGARIDLTLAHRARAHHGPRTVHRHPGRHGPRRRRGPGRYHRVGALPGHRPRRPDDRRGDQRCPLDRRGGADLHRHLVVIEHVRSRRPRGHPHHDRRGAHLRRDHAQLLELHRRPGPLVGGPHRRLPGGRPPAPAAARDLDTGRRGLHDHVGSVPDLDLYLGRPDAHHLARRRRRHCLAGGRHRRHEHHARLRHRAHPRDRAAQGLRCHARVDPQAVPRRGIGPGTYRGCPGRAARNHRRDLPAQCHR